MPTTEKGYDWGAFLESDPLDENPPLSPSAFGKQLLAVNDATGALTLLGISALTIPDPTGQTGKFLTTDGINLSWATASGGGGSGLTGGTSGHVITASGATTIQDSGVVLTNLQTKNGALALAGFSSITGTIAESNVANLTTDLAAKQPLDSDLTAIAALTTTSFGRGLLTETNAASIRSTIGAGTSSFSGLFTGLDFTSSNLTSIATRNFSDLQSKPTTLGGYGITDSITLDANSVVSSPASVYFAGKLAYGADDHIDRQTQLHYSAGVVTDQTLYTTLTHTSSGTYVRNTNNWLRGTSTNGLVDLTSIAVYNSVNTLFGVTLISPRHFLFYYPAGMANGTTIRFVTNTNTIVSRTVSSTTSADTFFGIGKLDSDLPNTISFAKVLPALVSNNSQIGRALAFVSTADQKVWIADQGVMGATSGLTDSLKSLYPLRASIFKLLGYPSTSDRGSPYFYVFDRELVLAGIGNEDDGGFYSVNFSHAAINAAMTTLGGGYQLTDYASTVLPPHVPIETQSGIAPDGASVPQGVTLHDANGKAVLDLGARIIYDINGSELAEINGAGTWAFQVLPTYSGTPLATTDDIPTGVSYDADNLSELTDFAAARTNLGLVIGTNVQAYDSGLGLVKPAVAVVAVSNLTLSGEQTIDGITTSSSLVLCTAQTTGANNGPWISNSGAWTRPTWYSTGSTTQAPQFLTTFVRLGTTYQGSTWRMTTAAVTIGTTTTTWVQTPIALGNLGGLGTGVATALAINTGSAGAFLLNNGSAANLTSFPTLNQNTSGSAASLSATLVPGSGGTGLTSYAIGDLLYASGSTTLSKLADVATGSVLVSGGVTTAPAWSSTPTFTATNVTGLPITGITSSTSAQLRTLLSDENGTGVALFDSNTGQTLATPVINGLPTGTGVASAATASTLVARDSSGNINVNSVNHGYATTVTAAGTTTLTVASANLQYFTGSTTQTVVLPVTSTLVLGQRFIIANLSTGAVTVNSSGSNAVFVLSGGATATFTCILTSGTTAASWNAASAPINISGTSDGTKSLPAVRGSDSDSGMFFSGNTTGFSVDGAYIMNVTGGTTNVRLGGDRSLGWTQLGTDASGTIVTKIQPNSDGVFELNNGTTGQWIPLLLGKRDSGTTTVVDGITLGHQSSGTPAAGLGIGMLFNINSSTTADQNAARIAALWTDATHATRSADTVFYNVNSAAALAETFRIKANGVTVHTAPDRLKGYTVAGLPAGTQGDTAFATDLLTPTFLTAAVGGGAIVGPVFYNGTAWVSY